MPAEVTLIAGPSRSGKTARLVAIAAAELARGRSEKLLGTALWLTPNFRAVEGVRQRLLEARQSAALGLGIRTFDQFAEALLGGAIEAARPLSQLQKRQLLAQVLVELQASGKLAFFKQLADRSSLVETVGRTIAELKRRGITPAVLAKRAKRSTATDRDREVAGIFSEYQRRLDTHSLYDVDDRLPRATEQVCRAELGSFADLRLIVVDGFTRFTSAQLEFLRAWAARIERIAIALDFDDNFDRPELFATPRTTINELREKFGNLSLEQLPESRRVPAAASEIGDAALACLRQRMFGNPRALPSAASTAPALTLPLRGRKNRSPPPEGEGRGEGDQPSCIRPTADGIEIIAAASVQDEVMQVARRVKRLLGAGVPARDIIVTARTLSGLSSRIADLFGRFGIPAGVERWRTLGEDPLLRTLIALLELDAGDWPFWKLVRVLTNRRITAWNHGNRRGAAEWVVRELQFAKGRQALLKAVNSSLVISPSGGNDSAGAPDDGTTSDVKAEAAAVLTELADAIDSLPKQALPLAWYTALEQLAKRLGIEREHSETMKELRRAMRSLEQLAICQGDTPQELDRAALAKLLRDIASHEPLLEPMDETGCVRVVSAPTARLLPAKHLFVMGMVEQSFPPLDPVGELYSDRELDALAGVFRGDEDRADSASREMLLFYELLCQAGESIVFSYAALDPKAQPQFASPYLQEVERLFAPGAIRCTQPNESMRPVPSGSPASDADWRLQAVVRALDGDAPLLAGFAKEPRTTSTARAILAGLEITRHRARGESFGPFEGVFAAGPAHRALEKRYDGEHLWSPSQLERYAHCPFKFMMEQVCRFVPPGELLLDTDPMRKGTLAHEALSLLHRKLRQRVEAQMAVSHLGADTLREEYLAALEEARQRLPREGVVGALADLERDEIARWAEAYSKQHVAYDEQWSGFAEPMRPSHFEVRFGPARGSTTGEDGRSTDEPFVLKVGDEELRFTGRIDRIDVGRTNGQTLLTIVDYKSGKTVKYSTEDVEVGKQLQLVLYAMAAEQHLFRGEGAKAIQAGYWALADDKLQTTKTKRWVDFCSSADGEYMASEDWSKTWETTGKRIGAIVRGIRRGEFPMVNTELDCTSTCDYRTVCRVAVARNVEKVWSSENR